MTATSNELKAISQCIVNGHRREVVSLVSLRNVLYASTLFDAALQEACLIPLYLAINARMREIGGDMNEFDRCAQDMHRAAITLGVLNECPD